MTATKQRKKQKSKGKRKKGGPASISSANKGSTTPNPNPPGSAMDRKATTPWIKMANKQASFHRQKSGFTQDLCRALMGEGGILKKDAMPNVLQV